ncbi:unnamed protein product [Heligmosomoides polygyrus]|uniref:Uncharacterized protein n=1 Tax=Heligmosomoides polygyrus TaxID=6339 RepID=A0A183FSM2_HELPZ|nr:unnamed protein product [Heligmosomoides polygyrus]
MIRNGCARKCSEFIPPSPSAIFNGVVRRDSSPSHQPLLDKRRYSSVDGVRSLNDRYHDRYSPFKRKSFKRRTEDLLNVIAANECERFLEDTSYALPEKNSDIS